MVFDEWRPSPACQTMNGSREDFCQRRRELREEDLRGLRSWEVILSDRRKQGASGHISQRGGAFSWELRANLSESPDFGAKLKKARPRVFMAFKLTGQVRGIAKVVSDHRNPVEARSSTRSPTLLGPARTLRTSPQFSSKLSHAFHRPVGSIRSNSDACRAQRQGIPAPGERMSKSCWLGNGGCGIGSSLEKVSATNLGYDVCDFLSANAGKRFNDIRPTDKADQFPVPDDRHALDPVTHKENRNIGS